MEAESDHFGHLSLANLLRRVGLFLFGVAFAALIWPYLPDTILGHVLMVLVFFAGIYPLATNVGLSTVRIWLMLAVGGPVTVLLLGLDPSVPAHRALQTAAIIVVAGTAWLVQKWRARQHHDGR
jgi:hypothetical protein